MDAANWVLRVNDRIAGLVTEMSDDLAGLGPDAQRFTEYAGQALSGGKRFRALFCALGYASLNPELPESLELVAAGLEYFHAAALAHDDIMDKSDTRRGRPAAHRHFQSVHESEAWSRDSAHYGVSAALLVGDYLLAGSDLAVARGLAEHANTTHARRARSEFDRMKLDVTVGQYLDIVEENAWPTVAPENALRRAETVVTYKSAKYSIEAPLIIGALLAGADDDFVDSIRRFALPLGDAFQLRDDLLGVFGDESITGKPVGDDIREGKRTVLIALAMPHLSNDERDLLNTTLGNTNASLSQVTEVMRLLEETQARSQVEERINAAFSEAMLALNSIPVHENARDSWRDFAERVVRRDS